MAREMTLDAIDRRHGILWRFDTARFTVAFWAEEEDLHPADSFCDERDVAFASDGDPAHWFCAFVGVFDAAGRIIEWDTLGGCSYGSFEEFYSAHRWRYSQRQRRFVTDPRSRAWKACNARQTGYEHGTYFTDMVREVCRMMRKNQSPQLRRVA